MPRLSGRVIAVLLLTLAPLAAHAEWETVWDFRSRNVPGSWDIGGGEMVPTEDGLRIRVNAEGGLTRPTLLTHPADVVTVHVAAVRQTKAYIIWHPDTEPEGTFVQLPFTIPQSSDVRSYDLIVSNYAQWDPETDALGFYFPEGADLLLQTVYLRGWTPWEKVVEAWNTFWTPDSFRPYSINFLWGPLLTFNPFARNLVYEHLPPFATSGVRVFYVLLGASLVCYALARFALRSPRWTQRMLALFLTLFVSLWVLFDLRMIQEIGKYIGDDWTMFVSEPLGQRELRTHGSFYDVLEASLPHLTQEEKYAAFLQMDAPFYANMRYYTYPSLPMLPHEDLTGVKLFFVYRRPDIRVEGGRLVSAKDGMVLAGTGQILRQFESGTFLFRSQ